MAEWYLWDGEGQHGPMERSELDSRIRHHPHPDVIHIWRNGFSDWKTVEDEAFDRNTKLIPDGSKSNTQQVIPSAKSQNIIAKNWRGEYPLWISYWVIGILTNIAAVGMPVVIGQITFNHHNSYNPAALASFFWLMWVVVVSLSIWQWVGIWRSAQRRINEQATAGKSATWAGLAKIAVCLGVLQLCSALITTGIPQILEATTVAFMDDPNIPPYAIRIMNNGSEAEITGGIKYGLTADFEKILNAARSVRVVHLDSVGGRIGEGEKLNALIRSKKLDTFVDTKCLSACTLAFAGGKQRILKKGAMLGFHRAAFAGEDQVDGRNGIERAIYGAAGINGAFIDRALATKNRDMWTPNEQELMSAGVITRVSTGDEFALGGIGGNVFTRDDWDKTLVKTGGVYRALKEKHPKSYDEILDTFASGFERGTPQAELLANARGKLNSRIKALLPLADDAVMIEYGRLVVAQYKALQSQNAIMCYRYASGTSVDEPLLKMIPGDLTKRELDVNEQIILSARARGPAPNTEPSWAKVRTTIAQQGYRDDLKLLSSKTVPPVAYARYCATAIIFYQAIVGLPANEAAAILRELFAES